MLDGYQHALEIAVREAEPLWLPADLGQDARFALWALYGTPESPVFQPAEDSRRFEDLVLAIWGQQWPALRASFRFCSGAIGNRTIDGLPFDLQVTPITSIREVRREVSRARPSSPAERGPRRRKTSTGSVPGRWT